MIGLAKLSTTVDIAVVGVWRIHKEVTMGFTLKTTACVAGDRQFDAALLPLDLTLYVFA